MCGQIGWPNFTFQPVTSMQSASLLRVERIRVSGLFGLYTHSVELNPTDRITIIHGPNGVGKTVLLRLVHALFSGRFNECARTPMDNLEIALSDGTSIGFQPMIDSASSLSDAQISNPRGLLYLTKERERKEHVIEFDQRELSVWATKFADDNPYLVRLESGK